MYFPNAAILFYKQMVLSIYYRYHYLVIPGIEINFVSLQAYLLILLLFYGWKLLFDWTCLSLQYFPFSANLFPSKWKLTALQLGLLHYEWVRAKLC